MARLLVAPDPSGRLAHLERTAAHAEGGADRAPDTVLSRSPCKLKGSNMTESPPKRARTMPAALKEEMEKSMPEIGEIEYHTKTHKKGLGRRARIVCHRRIWRTKRRRLFAAVKGTAYTTRAPTPSARSRSDRTSGTRTS